MFGFEWLTWMCMWYVATDPYDDDQELDGEPEDEEDNIERGTD